MMDNLDIEALILENKPGADIYICVCKLVKTSNGRILWKVIKTSHTDSLAKQFTSKQYIEEYKKQSKRNFNKINIRLIRNCIKEYHEFEESDLHKQEW